MLTAFETSAAYGQIALFAKKGPASFPHWTDDHVAQGFAMTPSAVSFLLPEHVGSLWVEIDVVEVFSSLPKQALRCIEVPFRVPEAGLGFSSLDGEMGLDVVDGEHRIRFTVLPGRPIDGNWATHVVRIEFGPPSGKEAKLVLRAAEMTAETLLLSADPLS